MKRFKLTGPSWDETLEAMKNMTPDEILIKGAKYRSLKVIKYALDKGADIHTDNENALRWSAFHGNLEAIKFFLDHGVDIHAYNDDALFWAKTNSHTEVIKALEEYIQKLNENTDF